jgi:GPH family glycoside/pentoside/hexuronide:cation symporter
MKAEKGALEEGPNLAVRTAFGMGALSAGVLTQALSTLALLFYNQVIGMSPATVGLALMISLIFDAFWDPAIGLGSEIGRAHV